MRLQRVIFLEGRSVRLGVGNHDALSVGSDGVGAMELRSGILSIEIAAGLGREASTVIVPATNVRQAWPAPR